MDLDGIVATNTTISREDLATPASVVESYGAGGVSGRDRKSTRLNSSHRT